ncbi:MAG TPA: ABC transporter ATP-binding protein, partial [Coriobacteriia bacterium]|nr:ABC transporter ATP-binding protein [Coriobacteriia bacterium]
MTVQINCKDVFLEYPGAKVLAGVTLGVDESDRIGIVGLNGSGKSSLLTVLAGLTPPDEGEVTRRSGITVGLLAQNDTLCESDSVLAAATG